MLFYFYLYILELCSAVAYRYSKNYFSRNFMKFLCFFVLFFPAAIRYNIGFDYKSYVKMFNTHSGYGEIGWHWIENIVRFYSLDVQWVFVFSSALIYSLLLKIEKKDFVLLITLYYFLCYTESYNIIRNYISISIFIFSYYLFLHERYKLSVIVCSMGLLFHTSSIIFLLLLIVPNFISLKKKHVLILAFILGMIFLQLDFNNVIDSLANSSIDFKYFRYLTSMKYGIKSGGFGLGSILDWIMLFVSYICCDERYCSKKEFSAISLGFILLWLSYIVFVKIQIFYRVIIVLSVVYLMMFRTYLHPSRNLRHLIGKIVCFIYLFGIKFLEVLVFNSNGAVPYVSIWGK